MARPLGPLDRGQYISTLELLSAVEEHGPRWPAQLGHYVLEAVSIAVQREINARNLYDAAHLTEQGRANLARLGGSDAYRSGHLSIHREDGCADHPFCWRIDCLDCGDRVRDHITAGELERVALDTSSRHRCA